MSWTVGEIAVHRIDEIEFPAATGPWLLPGATAEVVSGEDWLRPDFADGGAIRLHSHSFAFEKDGMKILVDTGIGNGKTRANPAWHGLGTGYLDALAAAGFAPDEVDLVLLTHLHADHVGWNTREQDGEWVPTFPCARHVTARVEREFWAGYAMDEPRRQMFEDSVLPVERAGLLDLVDVPADGVEIVSGVRLLPTPGHTPGHVSIELRSAGETALITGDAVHHPVQFAHPEIGASVDIDPAESEKTRRRLLAELADSRALVLGTHFTPPTGGHLVRNGASYRLVEKP
ncbi:MULTISPECIES: MBL fold metallo-hydrolase [unclassified Amycolatopsis]|uniref:MBL fold metallo-hydrolase n=1 Tax=unclassified Amycolatopsis TaxID=2618356 RepID=UPI001EE7AAE9|nr:MULTISPECIES: MBL fold metallo-hydrolase [unclassified Amycolatopsis]MCG3755701.1 MBL fold metallo-hydrolase [Amycolatopsis sp. Poz14]